MADHAVFAPSSAQRVIDCPASFIEEQKYEDAPREYTAEGTLAHDLIDMYFADGIDPQSKLGKVFEVDGFKFTVKQDMIDHVLGYIAFVEEHSAGALVVMGEKRVHYGPLVFGDRDVSVRQIDKDGVPYEQMIAPKDLGFGRMDTSWVRPPRITIVDFKYGYTVVDPVENAQGMLYALGILHELSWMDETFEEVEIIIYQPRIGGEKPWSSWVVSVDHLMAFAERFEAAALAAMVKDAPFNPSEKACQFCNARAHCKARREATFEIVAGFAPATIEEFDAVPEGIAAQVARLATDPEFLSLAMTHVGEIEDFCKAVRAEVERRLLRGQEVDGFKLVEGRLGNRAWVDEAAAEAQLKAFRLKTDEMYDRSLISPTQAEKVLKKDKPSQWKKLQGQIHRAQGRPSVAPVSDSRPVLTLTATAEDFV